MTYIIGGSAQEKKRKEKITFVYDTSMNLSPLSKCLTRGSAHLRVTSHTRLRAHDHYTASTLIGGKGRAGRSSLHNTLEGPMEYVHVKMKTFRYETYGYNLEVVCNEHIEHLESFILGHLNFQKTRTL
jgi:late competence protein required for DNA uptake (superfamily II DNA/RNA helicase)